MKIKKRDVVGSEPLDAELEQVDPGGGPTPQAEDQGVGGEWQQVAAQFLMWLEPDGKLGGVGKGSGANAAQLGPKALDETVLDPSVPGTERCLMLEGLKVRPCTDTRPSKQLKYIPVGPCIKTLLEKFFIYLL